MKMYFSSWCSRLCFGSSLCVILSFLSVAVAERKNDRLQTTRVVVLGIPRGTWVRNSRGVMLEQVQAEIRNMGSAPAKNIVVTIEAEGGAIITIRHSGLLGIHTSIKVAKNAHLRVVKEGRLRAQATCDNCRGE